jgi:acyl-CoA thioester hydrolase
VGQPYGQLEAEHEVQLVYVSTGCDHHERTLFGDPLQVTVEVVRLGRTSLTTRYRIERAPGCLAATGRLVSVCLDKATRQPRPLPDALRTAMAPYVAG